MSENLQFTSDFLNSSNRLMDIAVGLLISELIRQIRKNHLLSRKYNIRRHYGWFKIISYLFSAMMLTTLETRLSKIRLKPLAKMCNNMTHKNIKNGIETFSKTEPELFLKIANILNQLNTDYKVYKTTGIKSAFLEKYLPNLT